MANHGRTARTLLHERFVDAIRACLDLDPLYPRGTPSEAERFYREPVHTRLGTSFGRGARAGDGNRGT